MSEYDQETIDSCDMVVWYVHDAPNVVSKFYRNNSKIERDKKTDLGYKYNILIFREEVPRETAEFFPAIIGDTIGYIERLSNNGYSGLMFKKKSVKIDTVKKTIVEFLTAFGFTDKEVRKFLKEAN